MPVGENRIGTIADRSPVDAVRGNQAEVARVLRSIESQVAKGASADEVKALVDEVKRLRTDTAQQLGSLRQQRMSASQYGGPGFEGINKTVKTFGRTERQFDERIGVLSMSGINIDAGKENARRLEAIVRRDKQEAHHPARKEQQRAEGLGYGGFLSIFNLARGSFGPVDAMSVVNKVGGSAAMVRANANVDILADLRGDVTVMKSAQGVFTPEEHAIASRNIRGYRQGYRDFNGLKPGVYNASMRDIARANQLLPYQGAGEQLMRKLARGNFGELGVDIGSYATGAWRLAIANPMTSAIAVAGAVAYGYSQSYNAQTRHESQVADYMATLRTGAMDTMSHGGMYGASVPHEIRAQREELVKIKDDFYARKQDTWKWWKQEGADAANEAMAEYARSKIEMKRKHGIVGMRESDLQANAEFEVGKESLFSNAWSRLWDTYADEVDKTRADMGLKALNRDLKNRQDFISRMNATPLRRVNNFENMQHLRAVEQMRWNESLAWVAE